MTKSSSIFVCQNCEAQYPKWQGQCSECGQWNTLAEELAKTSAKGRSRSAGKRQKLITSSLVKFSEVEQMSGQKERLSTQIGELDRVLGGGLVGGAVILLGGEPGIGKSTLLTQVVINLLNPKSENLKPKQNRKTKTLKIKQLIPSSVLRSSSLILYVAGEESPSQISLRIRRMLGNNQLSMHNDQLLFSSSTDVDELTSIIEDKKPTLVIVDSIQTLSTDDLSGASGSVGQIRECTERLTEAVKRLHIPTFLVGHVTKDGVIAGPKVLEHMVDAVLELSGERSGQLRLLRAVKNRFGATDEVGVFQSVNWGLEEVSNPHDLFLEHTDQLVPGSATVCVLEGTRPLLVEVQALVVSSQLAMPRRVGRGIELSRIQVLAAVLQKHAHLPLGSTDIFLSAAGGFKIREPAVDLGLAVAIASSLKNKAIPKNTIFIGEIGLLGEIRSVSYLERRIKEAKRLGFEQIISRQSHKTVGDALKELELLK